MAEYFLDRGAKFAKRLMVFRDLEQWIVSKSAGTRWLGSQDAATSRFAIDLHVALWIGQRHVARVERGPLLARHVFQLFERHSIVVFVGRFWTGEPGRVNSRFTAERIDRDTAVFAKDPCTKIDGLFSRLFGRVLGEGTSIFCLLYTSDAADE